MARSKGLLYWMPEEEVAALHRLLADDPELLWAPLGSDGGVPPGVPSLDQAVILTTWTALSHDLAVLARWRRVLAPAAVAVVVLASRETVGAALREIADEIADLIEWPGHPDHLAHKIRRIFRAAIDREEAGHAVRAELARQVVDFHEFNRVALALSAERDVNRLLDLIVSKCREVTVADAGSLYLVEEKDAGPGEWDVKGERSLRFVVAQNDSKSLDLKTASLPLNRSSIAGHVALTRTPLNLTDVHALPPSVEFSFMGGLDRALNYRTISMLAIPMVDHTNEIIGVVQVINKKRSPEVRLESPETAEVEVEPFGPRDQEMVTSLASLAAVALNKALLITRIERLLEGIVRASVTAIEQRDPATAGHSDRVARFTVGLARVVDRITTGEYRDVRFTREELTEIEYASLLHDIGKVGVREPVLLKGKKLFDTELGVIRARFDLIKRTLQHDSARRMMETLIRLGPDAARPHLKQLEEELERRLAEVDDHLALVHRLNEPSVVRAEVALGVVALGQLRYPDLEGVERPYLTEYEIGNLSIPAGSLNEAERLEIQSHVTHSFRFLMQIPWTKELRRVPLIAYSHHERLDGSGYPRRVRDVEVPIQARMMAISDVFDALTAADRPYKPAVSLERALGILGSEARGGRLDATLLDLFVEAKVFAAGGARPPRSE